MLVVLGTNKETIIWKDNYNNNVNTLQSVANLWVYCMKIAVAPINETEWHLACDAQRICAWNTTANNRLSFLTKKDTLQCSSHTPWVQPEQARLILSSQWETALKTKPEVRLKYCFYSSDKKLERKWIWTWTNLSVYFFTKIWNCPLNWDCVCAFKCRGVFVCVERHSTQ